MLRIYLLGGLRAELDGHPLPLPEGPDLALLWAYLLLHPQRRINRSQLAFTLWPDHREEEALAHLRRCLHQLRRLLPHAPAERPWLLMESRAVGWNPDAAAWLDVEQFCQDCAAGTVEPMTAGVALYRGDLLPGLPDEWLLTERARLRLQYLETLDRLITLHAAGGDYTKALAAAEALFRQEPYREATLRWCMRLRYLCGDRAAALRQYNEFLARLKHDGQISPETAALRASIAAGATLPSLAQLPDRNGPPEQAQPATPSEASATIPASNTSQKLTRPLKPRRLLLSVAAILSAVGVVVAIWIARPFYPLVTLTLADPAVVSDTWIVSSRPAATEANDLDEPWLYVDLHDGRGPINPRVPFARYPAAKLNLANTVVSHALLYFDLNQLPAHCHVTGARLTLYLEADNLCVKQQGWPAVTIAAYRLLREWEANTATFSYPWAEFGLQPGSDYAPSPVDQQTALAPGPLTLDLTAAMPAWQNGQNYGLALMVTQAPAGCSPYWVDTVEHPDPTRRPQLVIQYR